MNVQQRLAKLEQAIAPAKDTRGPLLIVFTIKRAPEKLAAILYIYNGVVAGKYRLNSQQLVEYETSKGNGTTEVWLNTVPRTAGATV